MQITEEIYTSWIPHGFDTYNPRETQYLRHLQESLSALFQSEGFSEIMLPGFDYSHTFRLTGRGNGSEKIFDLRDADGELLSVRSDITVQVIKAAANHRFGSDYPKKLSYFQPVYQDLTVGSGRRREIHQAGIEILSDSPVSVSDLILLGLKALDSIGCSAGFIYGDARFIENLFAEIPASHRRSLSDAFHNKDTSLIASVSREASLRPDTAELLKELPLIFGGREIFPELRSLCAARTDLLPLIQEAENLSRSFENMIYDFSMVKELSYYTGPVFEAYIHSSRSRILSGGIYNNLFSTFSRSESARKQAGGFAVDLTALLHTQQRETA